MVFFSASVSVYAEGREHTWRYEMGNNGIQPKKPAPITVPPKKARGRLPPLRRSQQVVAKKSLTTQGKSEPRSNVRSDQAQYGVPRNEDRMFSSLSLEAQELQRSLRQTRDVTTSIAGGSMQNENCWSRFCDRLSLQTLLNAYKRPQRPKSTNLSEVRSTAGVEDSSEGSWVEVSRTPEQTLRQTSIDDAGEATRKRGSASPVANHAAKARGRRPRQQARVFITPRQQMSPSSSASSVSSESLCTADLSEESPTQLDDLADPFISQPGKHSAKAETELRGSFAEWRKSQIETVHSLFEHLRVRDQARESVVVPQSSTSSSGVNDAIEDHDDHFFENEGATGNAGADESAESSQQSSFSSREAGLKSVEGEGFAQAGPAILDGSVNASPAAVCKDVETSCASEDVMEEDGEWLVL